jgi:hypothetical protein
VTDSGHRGRLGRTNAPGPVDAFLTCCTGCDHDRGAQCESFGELDLTVRPSRNGSAASGRCPGEADASWDGENRLSWTSAPAGPGRKDAEAERRKAVYRIPASANWRSPGRLRRVHPVELLQCGRPGRLEIRNGALQDNSHRGEMTRVGRSGRSSSGITRAGRRGLGGVPTRRRKSAIGE